MKFVEFIKNVINTILDGSFERVRVISSLNDAFKISIQNDNGLGDAEMREISQYILGNLSFVKRLMALGFDTLIIYGATTNKSCTYALKEYANLNNFFLM